MILFKNLFVAIKEDRVLLWLTIGIIAPLLLLVLAILASYLQLKLVSWDIFGPSFYIFTLSLFSVLIYVPFLKKRVNKRSDETKILILLWLLISFIVSIIWVKISSFPLSSFKGTDFTFLLLPVSLVLIVTGIPLFVLHFIMNRQDAQSRKVVLISIIVSFFLILIASTLVYYLRPLKIQVFYPYTFNPPGPSYACEGLLLTSALTDDGKIDQNKKGVYGEVTTNNLDKLAISINGDKLEFNTAASISVGDTKGRPMNIIENSDSTLVAADRNLEGLAKPYDVFTMNKKNGMAVWSNSLATGFPSEDPLNEVEYFVCR